MNSQTHHNDSSIYNANLNPRSHQPRERDRQVQQPYVSQTRNVQHSSAAMGNNDGLGTYSGSPSSHCHCGCHQDRRMEDTASVPEVSSIEDTSSYLDSFPVGYRFCPTDEELVKHYLLKKIKNEELPKNKIVDVDIYQNHPKKIVENQPEVTEGQWYFFSSRNRKYVNGKRPGRKAGPGYWKATGSRKKVLDDRAVIGFTRSLAYYKGVSPNGIKTNWIMKEYVVAGHKRKRLDKYDMKLDDYVLYKIYQTKRNKKVENKQVPVTSNSNVEDENPTICDSNQVENSTICQDERGQEQVPVPNRDPRSRQFENSIVQNSNQEANSTRRQQMQVLASDRPVFQSKQAVFPNHHPFMNSNEQFIHPRTHRFERNPLSYRYQGTGLLNDLVSPNLTYPHWDVQPPVPTPGYLPSSFQFYSGINYDATMGFNMSNPRCNPQPMQMTPQAFNLAPNGVYNSVYSGDKDWGLSLDDLM